MHRSAEQWVQWAKQQHRYVIFHEERVIDVTQFIHAHPGGKKALIDYIYKDVTDILFKIYKHPKEQTLATLRHYMIGMLTPRDRSKTAESKSRSPLTKRKNKVCFQQELEEKESGRGKRGDNKLKSTHESSRTQNLYNSVRKQKKKGKQDEKNKRFLVSIKLLQNSEDRVIEDKYDDWDSNATKKPAQILMVGALQEDLDEAKPIFRVPVMQTKHMNRFQAQ